MSGLVRPRYVVHSLDGYNLPGTGQLATSYWVADSLHGYREVYSAFLPECGGGPGSEGKRLAACEQVAADLNRRHEERVAALPVEATRTRWPDGEPLWWVA